MLFDSGVIYTEDNVVRLHLTDSTYEMLKIGYTRVYTQLIHTYLNKVDAWEFLKEFAVKNDAGFYLPADAKINTFVEHYYKLYKEV